MLFRVLGSATLVSASAGLVAFQAPQAQRPVFQAGVDSLAVEVQVVDRDGHPIRGLGRESFTVTLGQQSRTVLSADWFEYTDVAGIPSPSRPSLAAPSAGPVAPEGRIIFLAIDEQSFSDTALMPTLADARRFIEVLLPEDYLGLIGFPSGRTYINPTRNRTRVLEALTPTLGNQVVRKLSIHLTPSEIVDITANDTRVLAEVEARECKIARPTCAREIITEARALAAQHEHGIRQRLDGLTALLRALAPIAGRKTVVVLSGGLLVSDRSSGRPNDVKLAWEAGRVAEQSNVSLYLLHQDDQFLDAMSVRHGSSARPGAIRDSSLMSAGLGAIAGTAAGHLADISAGTARDAFARIMREISGYYLMGISTEPRDRNGRPHTLNVEVATPGATVRHRRTIVISDRAPEP